MSPVAADRCPTAVGQPIELSIGPVAHGGHFVARHEGRVVFVRHGLPGERVRAVTTEAEPGSAFWRADVVDVLEPSADRVEHFWPEADAIHTYNSGARAPVGGAEFGHIRLAAQRELKARVLTEQLRRLVGLDLETEIESVGEAGVEEVIEGSAGRGPAGCGWRTRTGFAVTSDGRLGMHVHRSDRVLPVQHMPLASPQINALRLWDMDLTGLHRVEVASPAAGDALLVLLAGPRDAAARAAAQLPATLSAGSATEPVARCVPAARQVSAAHWEPGRSAARLRGRPWVVEQALGRSFRVSGEGFWQIHRSAPQVLAQAVRAAFDDRIREGRVVADLYAGAGLFTALLAELTGARGTVLSVEGSPITSKDARRNFRGDSRILVRPGRVERVLAAASAELGGRLEAVVLDPPRAGVGKSVVRTIVGSDPRSVVYVSCDPASFARDVQYFADQGWRLVQLRAFDLYPHTHHLEMVGLLVPGRPAHAQPAQV